MDSVFEDRGLFGPGLEEGDLAEPLARLEVLMVVSRGSGWNRRVGGGEGDMIKVGGMGVHSAHALLELGDYA